MSGATLIDSWLLALGVGLLVVFVAAVLLLMIILAARRIERLVTQALQVAEEIRANTQAIWELANTNQAATQLHETTRSIEAHAQDVAHVLRAHER